MRTGLVSWLLLAGVTAAMLAQTSSPETAADLARVFRAGQDALSQGRLDEAERDFREVLAKNPQAGGAYANLGVVYMRRKRWTEALETLRQAEHMMPGESGIRLNIGLAYFRQGEFLKAIAPFESVVREQPDSAQARNLLGQCYFFTGGWANAATTLEPLWPQESQEPRYLYMLSKAAHFAGRKDLDERAWAQFMKAGDTPEFHLLMGKDLLELEKYDTALSELDTAAEANPKLPFVHFYLGQTYLKKQDYARARDEFLKDAALDPDLALNYEELGEAYWLMQRDDDAEKSYREALRRDPRLVNSYVGEAKIYQRAGKYLQALSAIDAAGKLDAGRTDIHYLRGQVLLRMGRGEEGKKELEAAVRIDNERRAEREKQVEGDSVPSPELLQDER
jgi:tetratricopeptide (TPR) repeat protein